MELRKFYHCPKCGNIISIINDGGIMPTCCMQRMKELVPNATDAAGEKHVPVVKVEDNIVTVTVGSTLHPMETDHFIQWVFLQTEQGGQRKILHPGDKPEVKFALTDGDEPLGAFEYCNKHGLWYGA